MEKPRNPPVIRQLNKKILPPRVKIPSESVDYLDKEWVGMKKNYTQLSTHKSGQGCHDSPFSCKKGDESGREGVKLRD
jgi:hypothetical protein